MMLILDIVKSGKNRPAQKSFRFDKNSGSIGRSEDADFQLTDPQNYISGKHLHIEFKDNAYYVLDTSTNGTFLKHPYQKLPKGLPYPVSSSDIYIIGDHELQARLDEDSYGDDYIVGNLTPIPEPLASIDELIPDDDFLYDDGSSPIDGAKEVSGRDVLEFCDPISIIEEENYEEISYEQSIKARGSFGEHIRIPRALLSGDDLIAILEERLGFSVSAMSQEEKSKLMNDIADTIIVATQSISTLYSLQKTLLQNSTTHDL